MNHDVHKTTVWCKICGITSAQDAADAAAAGADAIGLNFYPASPRAVSAEHAARIVEGLDVTTVGLFVNPEPQTVQAVVEVCALDMLQFSGDEPEAFCRSFGLPYMKAVHVQD